MEEAHAVYDIPQGRVTGAVFSSEQNFRRQMTQLRAEIVKQEAGKGNSTCSSLTFIPLPVFHLNGFDEQTDSSIHVSLTIPSVPADVSSNATTR
eukprot:9464442-Pyramimonas_sp.AAC.2